LTDPLTTADLSAILDCVQAIHSVADASALPMAMLRAVGRLVRSSSSAVTQVDPVWGESSGCLLSPPPWTMERIAPVFQAHIADHPVVAHAQRTRDGQAMAISDFLTRRQFHATELYRELFGPMGVEDQLSIGMVGAAGLMIGLSFNRGRRGFSPRDRAVLNLLRPHLLQAYASCRDRQVLRNADGIRRGTVVDRLPLGLVCVDAKGRVIWTTDPVRQMLLDHFHDAASSIHGLPQAIRHWLRTAKATDAPHVSRGPGSQLHVRLCPLNGGHAVLLMQRQRQQQSPADPAARPSLDGYGLTPREAEVIQTILAGATASQASAKLGVSPRTAHKHLQRIFKKVGVNSLSAACVKLLGGPDHGGG
jgi:DNA-binding CsgD family transcriptional regulator